MRVPDRVPQVLSSLSLFAPRCGGRARFSIPRWHHSSLTISQRVGAFWNFEKLALVGMNLRHTRHVTTKAK
jgi:hypothetical protein